MSVVERAPAKLTLTLRVVGVRDDGFHALEALTVALDAPVDTLTVDAAPSGVTLTVDGPAAEAVPVDDGNLAVRAARAVLPAGTGVRIALHKEIPVGAGLGGGSSDAAAILRVCVDHFGADPERARDAAAALGSDVPFCLRGTPAWMRGRGEVLDEARIPEPVGVLVAVPPFALSTPAVYRAWDELGGPVAAETSAPPRALAGLVDALANDLEPAAEHVESRLAPFRAALGAAAGAPARLAGSGSACWVAFDDPDEGRAAAARVEADLGVRATFGLSRP